MIARFVFLRRAHVAYILSLIYQRGLSTFEAPEVQWRSAVADILSIDLVDVLLTACFFIA
jgi:hypothetical protein